MSRFKFLTPWISVILLSVPLLLRTPLPAEQTSSSIPKPSYQQEMKKERSLLTYESTLLSFFTHHQPPPPRQQKTRVSPNPSSPAMEEEIIIPPSPPEASYLGDRFIKLGQAQREGVLIFFIKDNQSGIIKEFILNREKDGYILIEKDDKYYLESKQGETYSL